MKRPRQPLFVAIVGGSGSGKTWLADKLQAALGRKAGRLSLDDFYRDRSHLSLVQRARINFDNPAAIDWPAFERALDSCLHWMETQVPRYDFRTHCRLPSSVALKPKPIILVDGLWLLRSPRIRRFFDFRIFLDSPVQLRLRRRLVRDVIGRGRSPKSVKEQFQRTVQPMHRKFVVPQRRFVQVTLSGKWGKREIKNLAKRIAGCLGKHDLE